MLSLYLIDLGASVSQVGLVFTVASLIPMGLQIFGGWFSDTIGRLRAIAIGSSISVFGYLLFFISPSWEWILLGLCVEYISNSFVGPSFAAYIAEQSSEGERGRVFGVTRGIYMVVTVIGPMLAGLLVQHFDFSANVEDRLRVLCHGNLGTHLDGNRREIQTHASTRKADPAQTCHPI
jgi:MFS family permease